MKTIIVGGGKVGSLLSSDLSNLYNDVTLIDTNEKIVEKIVDTYDIQGLVGNGANYSILREAGAHESDMFISVTTSDEINIISCITAKQMGAKYTIARIRNPEYSQTKEFLKNSLGIDLMINPEFEAAKQIMYMLKYPTANKVECFADNKFNILEVTIKEDSILCGVSLMNSRDIINFPTVVCLVERQGEVIVPKGDYIFQVGDKVHITASNLDLKKFYKLLGSKESLNKKLSSALIIGASKLTHYLVDLLLKNNFYIKTLEINEEKATTLSTAYPSIDVILADGSDRDILIEEGIETFDSCIALTGLDEENIIISLYGEKLGIKKSIAKINRESLTQIAEDIGQYAYITPKKIVSDIIIKHSKSLISSNKFEIQNLYRIADNRVELVEFVINHEYKVTKHSLKNLKINKNVLIAFIIRNGHQIFPNGDERIQINDNVVIVSYQKNIKNIDDILD